MMMLSLLSFFSTLLYVTGQNLSSEVQHLHQYGNPNSTDTDGLLFDDIMLPVDADLARNLAAIRFSIRRWETDFRDGYFHIPVRLSNFRNSIKEKIVLALRNLEWRSMVIKFDFIEAEPDNSMPYIHIQNGMGGCWSWMGLMPKLATSPNGQTIMLQQNLCTSFKTIQHEMLHALGFGHEHQREDRDDYITIIWENIRPKMDEQFLKYYNVNSLGTMYDYNSILHYPKNAFGVGGATTIGLADGVVIGNRHNASRLDILQIRLMYQCISGPRNLTDYKAQPCTTDCQCWKNQIGCGYDDDLCKGDLSCARDMCTDNADPTIKKIFARKGGGGRMRGKAAGVMFDFQAKENPTKITNLFYQGITEEVWVDIYTKEFTHQKWSEAEDRWTYIGEGFLRKEKAPGEPNLLPFSTFKPIKVKSWHKQGFYIQTKNCGNDCNKLIVWSGEHYADKSSPFVEDEYARILEGCALKSRFNNVGGRCLDSPGGDSQTFWGGFRYKILEEE